MDESHGVIENGTSAPEGSDTSGPEPWVKHGEVCGAIRGEGRPTCRMPAGWGTDHVGFGQCKFHGGRMRNNRVAAARQELAAVTGGRFMGMALDVKPAEAMLMCVQVAAGHVAYASQQVALVPEDEGFVDTVMGKQLHPWARIQAEAMDRLVRFSKMAVECGAEAHAVERAEREGGELARVLTAVFDEMELSEKQREALPMLLRKHLVELESTTEQTLGLKGAANVPD